MGTGGPKNFKSHLASKKHLMNVKAAEDASKMHPPALISNFFMKQHDPPPPYQVPPASQLLASKTPTLMPASTLHAVLSTDNIDGIDIDAISPLSPCNQTSASGTTATHPLMAYLHAISTCLLKSVPVGQESKPFATFSGNPRDLIVADDDSWESVIDPCLNHIIGFKVSTCQIADIIRCGPFGINGFCRWIEICVVKLEISTELLEMRLKCVFDALKLLYVSFLTFIIVKALSHIQYFHPNSGADNEPDITPAITEPMHPVESSLFNHEITAEFVIVLPNRDSSSVSHYKPILPVIASDNTNQSKSHMQSISDKCHSLKHCHGIQPDFGKGHTPAFSYPSQIHGAKLVPWTTLYSNNELWIQLDNCKHKFPSRDDSESNACLPCCNLLNHAIIRGIMEQDKLGA